MKLYKTGNYIHIIEDDGHEEYYPARDVSFDIKRDGTKELNYQGSRVASLEGVVLDENDAAYSDTDLTTFLVSSTAFLSGGGDGAGVTSISDLEITRAVKTTWTATSQDNAPAAIGDWGLLVWFNSSQQQSSIRVPNGYVVSGTTHYLVSGGIDNAGYRVIEGDSTNSLLWGDTSLSMPNIGDKEFYEFSLYERSTGNKREFRLEGTVGPAYNNCPWTLTEYQLVLG